MVDLKTQHDKLQPELNNKILEVVESTAYIKGEEVSLFEQELAEYLGVKHVIACANGTDALQLAMMALGLKSGDEVITANFTYVATAEIIA
ncbi:MAG: DegT/DnrJ/EryC1/StrS family aminotransferase, partial [Chitinophagales bacterium]